MRHLPPLSSLRTFEAVARLGSFRLAAEELNVTPTAVSHQITSLEMYCGQKLFRRRPRPLTLTEAGERLFPLIRDGLDLFAAAMEQIRERGRAARRLRVSTTNAFAARCLVPMLPIFHLENPAVELEVIGTDAVVDLRAGEVDVALRYAREMPRDGIALELTRDRFHVVAAPSLLGPGGAKSWRLLPRIAYDWLPSYELENPNPQADTVNLRPKSYVAVSATNLQGVYMEPQTQFRWLDRHTPVAQIGHSIFVYYIE